MVCEVWARSTSPSQGGNPVLGQIKRHCSLPTHQPLRQRPQLSRRRGYSSLLLLLLPFGVLDAAIMAHVIFVSLMLRGTGACHTTGTCVPVALARVKALGFIVLCAAYFGDYIQPRCKPLCSSLCLASTRPAHRPHVRWGPARCLRCLKG